MEIFKPFKQWSDNQKELIETTTSDHITHPNSIFSSATGGTHPYTFLSEHQLASPNIGDLNVTHNSDCATYMP